jgi:hypothetical protein
MHIFWIIGLLLALIDLPDFGTPLSRIATSAEKIAGMEPREDTFEEVPGTVAPTSPVEKSEASVETDAASTKGEGPSAPPTKPELARARKKKESLHA